MATPIGRPAFTDLPVSQPDPPDPRPRSPVIEPAGTYLRHAPPGR
ncbi:hypothetical protein [Streptomyces canus]|nr:hypothetical protein [Streptomyces canus]